MILASATVTCLCLRRNYETRVVCSFLHFPEANTTIEWAHCSQKKIFSWHPLQPIISNGHLNRKPPELNMQVKFNDIHVLYFIL